MVQCYHCRHEFEVGGMAQSTSCPGCNKPVIVHDIVVDRLRAGLIELRTCGRIDVKKRGRLMVAKLVEAHGGIHCDGVIDAKRVVSGSPVCLGAKCQFRGELVAPALTIAPGARVLSAAVSVPEAGPQTHLPPVESKPVTKPRTRTTKARATKSTAAKSTAAKSTAAKSTAAKKSKSSKTRARKKT
jgi:hypothetical protein